MSVGSLNWTAYCLPSNEYSLDKAAWAESVCKGLVVKVTPLLQMHQPGYNS